MFADRMSRMGPSGTLVTQDLVEKLKGEGIEPVLHFQLSPEVLPILDEMILLFETYQKWGVKYANKIIVISRIIKNITNLNNIQVIICSYSSELIYLIKYLIYSACFIIIKDKRHFNLWYRYARNWQPIYLSSGTGIRAKEGCW